MRKVVRSVAVMALIVLSTVTVFAETTLVFWHWDRADRHEKIAPLIEQFEKETGIKVEAQMVVWEELTDKLILGMAGGVGPDVTAISWDRSGPLVFQGIYEDLRPFIDLLLRTKRSMTSTIFYPTP